MKPEMAKIFKFDDAIQKNSQQNVTVGTGTYLFTNEEPVQLLEHFPRNFSKNGLLIGIFLIFSDFKVRVCGVFHSNVI